MFQFSLSLFFLFLGLAAHGHVPKRGQIYAVAGPYLYQTQLRSGYVGADNPPLGGFSLFVNGDVDKNGGLEIGLAYMQKLHFRKKGDAVLVEKIKRVKATTGYRHWFGPSISAAFLFYNAYAVGDVQTIHQSGVQPFEFKTSAHEISDDGFEVSLQYEFWRGEKSSAVVDLRYSYSMSNASGEIADLYGVIVGYKYLAQTSESPRARP